jgi:hypothetical protein
VAMEHRLYQGRPGAGTAEDEDRPVVSSLWHVRELTARHARTVGRTIPQPAI